MTSERTETRNEGELRAADIRCAGCGHVARMHIDRLRKRIDEAARLIEAWADDEPAALPVGAIRVYRALTGSGTVPAAGQ